jgi:hypothetical protein
LEHSERTGHTNFVGEAASDAWQCVDCASKLERWWQTFKLAILLAVLIGALWALLGCASAPKPGPCVMGDCGELCCNNDGKVCCPGWDWELEKKNEHLWDGPPLPDSEVRRAR